MRVVPNKFPALEIEGDLNKRGEGIYDMMRGVGAHEVIIESPHHLRSTTELGDESLRDVLWVYRDRLVDLKKDPRLVYGMIFKNVGAGGRRSLEHTHSQLIVTPIVPISVAEEIDGSQEFYRYRGRCVFCDMIQQELAVREADRVRHAGLRGLLPVRRPLSVRDLDRAQGARQPLREHSEERPGRTGPGDQARAGEKSKPPWTGPRTTTSSTRLRLTPKQLGHYHWHIEIIPRVTKTAGL